jgi:hypothetical protein
MKIMRALLLAAASLVGAGPALAQQTQLSTYMTSLAPAGSVIGTERMFALQTGVWKTLTPYQILSGVSGDCTIASPPSIICTKANGVAFAPSATTDTTNAANIGSGTLNLGRLSLATAFFFVGNGSSNPAGVAMSGDCTLVSTGVVTCTPSLSRMTLASASFYVGNASNNPSGAVMSGDCTLTNTGAVTCLKAGGVSLVASATTDTTSATNISSGTLAGARQSAANLAASGNGGVTGLLPFANLPAGSVDTSLGYWGSTVLSAVSMPNCSNALTYSTTTHTWGCNVGSGGNVVNSGTPTVGQIGVWVDATHLQGQNITALATINKIKTQTFTSNGTYTASAGLQYAIIECMGGGGAGGGTPDAGAGNGNSSGGGGAGGYSRSMYSAASIGASQSVGIGGGGSPNGGAGGTTSVGGLCSANGGSGGGVGPAGNGAPGGAAGTGNVIAAIGANGQAGDNQTLITITNHATMGGITMWGGAGAYLPVCAGTAANGVNASGYGAGGGGACTQNGAGGANGGYGAPGIVVITEFTNQ